MAIQQDAGESESLVDARADRAAVGCSMASGQEIVFLSNSWCISNFLLNVTIAAMEASSAVKAV